MSMDWFSRSDEDRMTEFMRWVCVYSWRRCAYALLGCCNGNTHCAACHYTHCLRWSRCVAASQSAVCLCRRRPQGLCKQAAICMDSPSHRKVQSRSEETGQDAVLTHCDTSEAVLLLTSLRLKCIGKNVGEGTHVDHPGGVASAQVVQHRRLIEVCQHSHVFNPVILWRIHLLDVPVLHCQNLRWRIQAGVRTASAARAYSDHLNTNYDYLPSHLWFQPWLCHRFAPWSQSRCTPLFDQGPRLASYLREQQRV